MWLGGAGPSVDSSPPRMNLTRSHGSMGVLGSGKEREREAHNFFLSWKKFKIMTQY